MRMEVIMTLERNIEKWLANVTKEPHNDISLPLHKHLHLWLIHTIMYVEYVTNQLEFLPAPTGFCLLKWAWRDYFLTEVLFFHKPWLNRSFFLMVVLFFHKPTWSSNRGGEWHRPRILRAWNRWSGQGIKPWTHKKIMLQGQGIEPWTHKKDRVQGQGFKPWTGWKDCSYDNARNRMWSHIRS